MMAVPQFCSSADAVPSVRDVEGNLGGERDILSGTQCPECVSNQSVSFSRETEADHVWSGVPSYAQKVTDAICSKIRQGRKA